MAQYKKVDIIYAFVRGCHDGFRSARKLGQIFKCKDCKHWNAETKGCKRNPSVEAWKETDFCSYGER